MKTLRFLAGAALLALLPALGHAQAASSKPIHVIAPFPGGSGPGAHPIKAGHAMWARIINQAGVRLDQGSRNA